MYTRINNAERESWIMNNEHLYKRYISSGLPIMEYIKKHKGLIDWYIRKCIGE